MIEPRKTAYMADPETASEVSLKSLAAEYDQAITAYENHYAQQQACYNPQVYRAITGSPVFLPEYLLFGSRSCGSDQSNSFSRTRQQYGQSLMLLEKSISGFNSAFPQLQAMEGALREKHVREWKEYLQYMTDINWKFSEFLTAAINSITPSAQPQSDSDPEGGDVKMIFDSS